MMSSRQVQHRRSRFALTVPFLSIALVLSIVDIGAAQVVDPEGAQTEWPEAASVAANSSGDPLCIRLIAIGRRSL